MASRSLHLPLLPSLQTFDKICGPWDGSSYVSQYNQETGEPIPLGNIRLVYGRKKNFLAHIHSPDPELVRANQAFQAMSNMTDWTSLWAVEFNGKWVVFPGDWRTIQIPISTRFQTSDSHEEDAMDEAWFTISTMGNYKRAWKRTRSKWLRDGRKSGDRDTWLQNHRAENSDQVNRLIQQNLEQIGEVIAAVGAQGISLREGVITKEAMRAVKDSVLILVNLQEQLEDEYKF